MALKVMIFIDGSWIFHNRQHLSESRGGEGFDIDYMKLPGLVKSHLERHAGVEIDVVRTFYFGSMPVNRPGFTGQKQQSFFNYLSHNCGFETEIYEIDFKNDLTVQPREKCVDVALAAAMLQFAAIPGAYDIAVLIAGDLDYLPAIRRARALGKRILLVAIREAGGYYPTSKQLMSSQALFDYPVLFLDDHVEDIRLRRVETVRVCMGCGKKESTFWQGEDFYCLQCRIELSKPVVRACDECGKEVSTTWRGAVFFCDECRRAYRESRQAASDIRPPHYAQACQLAAPIWGASAPRARAEDLSAAGTGALASAAEDSGETE